MSRTPAIESSLRLPNVRTVSRGIRGPAALGAALVVLLLVASTTDAGALAAPRFPGATWTSSLYLGASGCARSYGPAPHWNTSSGIGHDRASTSAKICPASRGGSSVSSFGDVDQTLTVTDPVTFATGPGGAIVDWNLRASMKLLTNASLAVPCPVNPVAFAYWNGSTWENWTGTSSDCAAYVELSVYPNAVIVDETNGTYFGATNNAGGGWFFNNDTINSTYNAALTFSNRSYWADNTTQNYSSRYNGGSGWSTLNLTQGSNPSFYINGSFVASHVYAVIAYVQVDVYAYITGFAAPIYGDVSVNLATAGNHETLRSITTW